jgi:hypothetical protein
MDRPLIGAVGRSGSGKTTLLRKLIAGDRRVLVWDWRGEYPGPVAGLRDLPALFARRSFRARYCPVKRPPGGPGLIQEFNALAYVVAELGRDLLLVADEVKLLVENGEENGVGWLLRYARPQGIGIAWATQTPTCLPSVLLGETRTLYVFHLDHPAHLSALRTALTPEELRRVAALPPYQYLTVNK